MALAMACPSSPISRFEKHHFSPSVDVWRKSVKDWPILDGAIRIVLLLPTHWAHRAGGGVLKVSSYCQAISLSKGPATHFCHLTTAYFQANIYYEEARNSNTNFQSILPIQQMRNGDKPHACLSDKPHIVGHLRAEHAT
jgi:hypothetical protein